VPSIMWGKGHGFSRAVQTRSQKTGP